eukprot:RCo006420
MSLGEQFDHLYREYAAIDQSELSQSDATLQRSIAAALQGLRDMDQKCVSSGMFSKNEELDDVPTGDLKFLAVPYLCGDLLIRVVDTEHLSHLMEAKELLTRYMTKCRLLGLVKEEEYRNLVEVRVGDRQSRIERHRKDKELVAKLAELNQRKKRLAKGRPAAGGQGD